MRPRVPGCRGLMSPQEADEPAARSSSAAAIGPSILARRSTHTKYTTGAASTVNAAEPGAHWVPLPPPEVPTREEFCALGDIPCSRGCAGMTAVLCETVGDFGDQCDLGNPLHEAIVEFKGECAEPIPYPDWFEQEGFRSSTSRVAADLEDETPPRTSIHPLLLQLAACNQPPCADCESDHLARRLPDLPFKITRSR